MLLHRCHHVRRERRQQQRVLVLVELAGSRTHCRWRRTGSAQRRTRGWRPRGGRAPAARATSITASHRSPATPSYASAGPDRRARTGPPPAPRRSPRGETGYLIALTDRDCRDRRPSQEHHQGESHIRQAKRLLESDADTCCRRSRQRRVGATHAQRRTAAFPPRIRYRETSPRWQVQGAASSEFDRHPAFTATTRAAPQPAAGVVFGENLQQVTNMRR